MLDALSGLCESAWAVARVGAQVKRSNTFDQRVWRLPSTTSGPLASSGLVDGSDAESEATPAVDLASWRIEGLTLAPGTMALGLARLSETSQAGADGAVAAPDLRFWGEVAKFVLELLGRQRFVPGAAVEGEGTGQKMRALWQPALDDPADARRLAQLAEAMPPVCRAGGNGDSPPSARALLLGFLSGAIDELIRGWAATPGRQRTNRPVSEDQRLSEKWTAALLSQKPYFTDSAAERRIIRQSLTSWLAPIGTAGQAPPFRACFRLEAPERPPGGDIAAAKPGARDWALRYHLQATDDLSLLIPAGDLWQKSSEAAALLRRRLDQPQEKLLYDLGRAGRLFPPIAESLRHARPDACALTTDEAFRFLREGAWLLEESGFGALVPPWWDRAGTQGARLGVRLELKTRDDPGTKTGRSVFGLDALADYDWQLAIGDDPLTADEFRRIASLKVPLVRVRGQWVALDKEAIEAAVNFWSAAARRGLPLAEALQAGLGGEAPGLPVNSFRAEGRLQEFLSQFADGQGLPEMTPPETFQGTLRPYQARGFAWLRFLRQWGLGACLADDMGLGKTIQFIAFLLQDGAERPRRRPTLLICPTSVVGNWQRELARFAPSLRVLVHHGTGRQSGKAFAREAARQDLVVSTYSLAHRDADHLTEVPWEGVVLDEAQNIKNPAAKQTQAVRRLQAGFRFALTGTPVENRLSELWSIMEFLNPGYLGPAAAFRRRFAIPIERYQEAGPRQALRQLAAPFILRRLKTDPRVIQDLPEKMEMKVYCTLTREQATLYGAVVQDMMEKIESAEGIGRRGQVLATLVKLKQVCNHPAQFLKDGSALEGRSGKLTRLGEMLEEALAEGDRSLLFTQFYEMGDLLRRQLQALFGREALFLHGGVPRKKREQMIQRFQDDADGPPVFILSIKAGGVGLNLTRANRVFHFDRWWNPAVENQATDRAFRIGQTRNVQVHKFVCLGTLEERIDTLIEAKKDLAESILGAGENWITEMSDKQLRGLFELRQTALAEV